MKTTLQFRNLMPRTFLFKATHKNFKAERSGERVLRIIPLQRAREQRTENAPQRETTIDPTQSQHRPIRCPTYVTFINKKLLQGMYSYLLYVTKCKY